MPRFALRFLPLMILPYLLLLPFVLGARTLLDDGDQSALVAMQGDLVGSVRSDP